MAKQMKTTTTEVVTKVDPNAKHTYITLAPVNNLKVGEEIELTESEYKAIHEYVKPKEKAK